MNRQNQNYIFSLVVYLVDLAAVAAAYIFPLGGALLLPLFPLVFASFALFVLELRRGAAAGWGLKPLASRARGANEKRCPPGRVLRRIPGGMKALVVLSVVYVLISFAVNGVILANGMPEVAGGVPLRRNHGQVTQITWAEYDRLRGAESRLFTGHLLAFAALPLGYFSGLRKVGPDDRD